MLEEEVDIVQSEKRLIKLSFHPAKIFNLNISRNELTEDLMKHHSMLHYLVFCYFTF